MSLKKIAQQLGISVTQVSRAMNNHTDVSRDTKQRVFAAAHAMGYQPNASARNLKMGRSSAIGLVYPFQIDVLNDICFTQMISWLNRELNALHFDLVLIPDESCNDMPAFSRVLWSQRIDALCIAHTYQQDKRISFLLQQKAPFLALGRTEVSEAYAWFDFDNAAGTRLATEHLIRHQHQAIAYIGGNQPLSFVQQRLSGYQVAMHAAQLTVPELGIQQVPMDRRSGYFACQKLLALPQPPTAIITDCNMLADGVATALEAYARQHPQSAPTLITYDGLPPDTLTHYPVIVIEQATRAQVGKQIASMLMALIAGEPLSALQVLWQPTLNCHTA